MDNTVTQAVERLTAFIPLYRNGGRLRGTQSRLDATCSAQSLRTNSSAATTWEAKDMSEKLYDAVIDYTLNGKTFSFYVPCASEEEARARVEAIRGSAQFEGWPCFRYSANPIALPFTSLWTSIKIWLFRRTRP